MILIFYSKLMNTLTLAAAKACFTVLMLVSWALIARTNKGKSPKEKRMIRARRFYTEEYIHTLTMGRLYTRRQPLNPRRTEGMSE
jgi:hypothetical protein